MVCEKGTLACDGDCRIRYGGVGYCAEMGLCVVAVDGLLVH